MHKFGLTLAVFMTLWGFILSYPEAAAGYLTLILFVGMSWAVAWMIVTLIIDLWNGD